MASYAANIASGFTRLSQEVKGKVSASLLSSKGDIIIGGTAGVPSRLAPGQGVLTQDASGVINWVVASVETPPNSGLWTIPIGTGSVESPAGSGLFTIG